MKKITIGLSKIPRHTDDREPTIEEIQQLFPDRRIKRIHKIVFAKKKQKKVTHLN